MTEETPDEARLRMLADDAFAKWTAYMSYKGGDAWEMSSLHAAFKHAASALRQARTPEETAALKEYKEAHRMWLLARQTLAETRRDEHG